MAQAPPVKAGGHEAAKERRKAAKMVARVTAPPSDLEFDVSVTNISMRTRRRVRQEAGEPAEAFLYRGGIGVDTYAHLWWISRLEAGEPISLVDAEAEWDEMYGDIQIGDIHEEDVTEGN